MENQSETTEHKDHEDEKVIQNVNLDEDEFPRISRFIPPIDPVRQQKYRDRPPRKPLEVIPELQMVQSVKIQPSVGTRLDMQYVHDVHFEENEPRPKYVFKRTKRQQRIFEKNRANTAKGFCKYNTVTVPEPIPTKKVQLKSDIPSPESSSAKVAPRRVTPTSSWLYPYPQTSEELRLKKPKSGIFINETEQKELSKDYDSFDLVFARKPRPDTDLSQKKKRRSKSGGGGLEAIDEEDGGEGKKKKKKKKRSKITKDSEQEEDVPVDEAYLDMVEQELGEQYGEEGMENYLTKQFRRKVSQISAATSYQSKDYEEELEEKELMEPAIDKWMQKFRRESEIQRFEPKKRKFKRGTLESHSFTDINQVPLRDFFFGSKEGTMHQGDDHFPENVRNYQGICMPVAAFCYSILKHPNKWTSENIDEILEAGTNLFICSRTGTHIHTKPEELKPKQLSKYCVIGEKKIKFVIEDPEVSGFIRSDDKRVYNLTKAFNIFFARQKAGLFITQETNIVIWKDKYFYMFDAKPRTKDLYPSPIGTAIMANFYDVPSLITVFLTRSNLPNWPFMIYPIKAMKVLGKDDIDKDEEERGLDVRSNYNILNQNKAVVQGSFDLADKCFDFARNKQSLAMSAVCLVYSRITPPSSWHRTTIDKIMIIGNQLYLECIECDEIFEVRIDNLPAIFTIGPYIVEIYIYVNRFVDMMYKNCACQFQACLEEFFDKSTNGIVQIGKFYLAVWKQRNMYYCFDPFSRDNEGFHTRDGTACVSMHANISSMVDTITTNFDAKDTVFHLHALKVCKIFRDPVNSKFHRHVPMEDHSLEEVKNYKMMKSKKPATSKPVTVDYSALAMRKLLAGESPDPSLFEVGSTVGSLQMDEIPSMLKKHPSRSVLRGKTFVKPEDLIADLDDPSLSDTQIVPPKPDQPKGDAEIEFMDLDSFELTMEEIEIEEEHGEDEYIPQAEGVGEDEEDEGLEAEIEEEMRQMGEGEDDWYYAMQQFAQVGPSLQIEPSKISEQINTDITFFPIHKEVLYPTYIRGKQQMKKRLDRTKEDEVFDIYYPEEPPVTQSEELRKETNFVVLPDDTEIVRGSKNLIGFGEDIEFMAPFMCVMAGVVSKKYSVLSWTPEIVDYILKCGAELYKASKFRYDQVSKLEIPRISLGKTNFTCLVQYVFDSYVRQNILELAISKILFVRSNMGVLVTPTYACGLIYKNHLYYMYDPFGNNEVGLSEGLSNSGVACFSRFKDLHSLTTRILYNKNKREVGENVVYTRFVISVVQVKQIQDRDDLPKKKSKKDKKEKLDDGEDMAGADMDLEEEPPEKEDKDGDVEEEGERKEPEIKIGYQNKDGILVIEGSDALEGREEASDSLKEDHFVCICASLMLLNTPITKWDNKRVDKALDYGRHVYSHADDLEISEKRTIKNVLIDKNFFDIIVKRIRIENWRNNKNLNKGIDTLLAKRLAYFLVQFPNACYVVHRTSDGVFHIFDPYGVPQGKKKDGDDSGPKAGWVRCKDELTMKSRLRKLVQKGNEAYSFYNFEVTSITKAPKDVLISFKLHQYDMTKKLKPETIGKPFYEDVEWLNVDPIPWTRRVTTAAHGRDRGSDHMWHNWDIEYHKDLYSLLGNVSQNSERFSEESRGKQTLASLTCCIGMLEIYDFTEWNSAVVDSILVNGDNYYRECVQDIKDEDYELSIDDMKEESSIFPFTFKVAFKPIVEGTMFLVRATQFNLYKALRYFFNNTNRRSGIICSTKSNSKKQVAFGKTKSSEYFMFDCSSFGSPMFLDKAGVAYILRMTTLNRLLHVLTLTLTGGDFYIYDVEVSNLDPMT